MDTLIDKIFTSPEIKKEFQHFETLQNEKEKEKFFADLKNKFETESDEKQKKRISEALEVGQNAVDELQELIILKRLESVSPYISLSEISRKYFGKSRG